MKRPLDAPAVGRVSEALIAADGSTWLLFMPPCWTSTPKSHPVMLFLHGIGGINNAAGCTNPGLTTQFPLNDPAFAATIEHIVLVPVAAKRDWRNHAESAMSLVDIAIAELGGDPSRVALAGQGMGGQGAWQLACMAPERFCAIVVICGWVDERNGDVVPPAILEPLKSKPVWALCVRAALPRSPPAQPLPRNAIAQPSCTSARMQCPLRAHANSPPECGPGAQPFGGGRCPSRPPPQGAW